MYANHWKLKKWHIVISLLIISILFENMKLFGIMGTSFKPTHIVFLLAIIIGMSDRYVRARDVLIGVMFLLLPCLPLYRISDEVEWLKSYVIYALLISFFVFAFRGFLNEIREHPNYYIKLFVRTVSVAQILGIIQFISMNWFNYFFLRDIFGRFEYQTNIFNMTKGFYRAYSVFHEPSFFGLVTICSITVLFLAGKRVFKNKEYMILLVLNIVSVFVSLSATCLISFLVLITIQQFVKDAPIAAKISSVLALGVVIITVSMSTTLMSPVMRLVTEVNRENSSGYERITTQIMYVKRTLQYYPLLGRGIGQEGDVDAVGTIGLYSATHNALAGIVVNFGLSALFIILPLLLQVIKKIRNNSIWAIVLACIVCIYASTGAYISVDTFNMVIIVISIGLAIEYIPYIDKHSIISNTFNHSV